MITKMKALLTWMGITVVGKLDADGHDSAACGYCKEHELGDWAC